VKEAALPLGVELSQPDALAAEGFRIRMSEWGPDAVVVVAYGKLIPGWLLRQPPRGVVNLHGSLLPRYRGAAPVNWAIARGESVTGVCAMQIDEGLDTGPVYDCTDTAIGPEETAPELLERLAVMGADLLAKTLEGIANGSARPRPQSEAQATLAPRLSREDGFVRWEESAQEIHDKTRAFLPWPSVVVGFRGSKCRLLASRVGGAAVGSGQPGDLGPGKGGLAVRCGDSRMLEILELQLENRRATSGRDFANGVRLAEGDRFTSLAGLAAPEHAGS
jgi:methionyl-tRNA formyltransferase